MDSNEYFLWDCEEQFSESEVYVKNNIWKKYRVGHIHYVILKRIFLSNPNLYKLVDGVICYENCFDIEFLTFNQDYKELWECLKKDNTVKLNEMGYDENLHCYVVDIHSPSILEFIKNVQRMWGENPSMKKRWIEKYG